MLLVMWTQVKAILYLEHQQRHGKGLKYARAANLDQISWFPL